MSGNDPYYLFKDDLLQKLQKVDETLETLKRIAQQHESSAASSSSSSRFSSSNSSNNFKQVRKELKKHLKSAEGTLQDLETAVSLLEKQGSVEESILYERRGIVQACQSRLGAARTTLNTLLPSNLASRQGHGGGDDASTSLLSGETIPEHSNNNHHSNSTSNTNNGPMTSRLLMQQQDDTLDELDAAVTRVGYMADNIHEEVESQNKMMNEMQNDLEAAEEELGLVMGKLGDFLQTKDKWQLCTILSLFGVAVLLLLLVVYT